jgi:hypothetical protein
MDVIKKNPKIFGAITVVVVIVVVIFIVMMSCKKDGYAEMADMAEVAEVAPIGTTQLDGDLPGHIASVNDPNFMTTPSIVLSTTSRGGENTSYKNVTTDIRGSIPRVYGGAGSTFNQNIQLEDTNIDPDNY